MLLLLLLLLLPAPQDGSKTARSVARERPRGPEASNMCYEGPMIAPTFACG